MDPVSGEIPVIPSTVESTNALLEQAEILAQRVQDNPDFKVMLDITHRTQRLSTFNFVYSIVLTVLFCIVGLVGWNTYHNGVLIDGIKGNCRQANIYRAADLESWRFIASLIPDNPDTQHILEQREKIDAPVDC